MSVGAGFHWGLLGAGLFEKMALRPVEKMLGILAVSRATGKLWAKQTHGVFLLLFSSPIWLNFCRPSLNTHYKGSTVIFWQSYILCLTFFVCKLTSKPFNHVSFLS